MRAAALFHRRHLTFRPAAALPVLTMLLTLASSGLAGCGPQAFQIQQQSNRTTPPGELLTPPKVDVLFVQDNTGSIFNLYYTIQPKVTTFLNQLAASKWDFHFATTPLVTLRPQNVNQVATGPYDGNYGSQWVSPYPGAVPQSMQIPSAFFRFPSQYTGFVSSSEVSTATGGLEPGFQTIWNALHTGFQGTGFQRPDAMLVIVMIGNGNDTSGVNFCQRPDQVWVPCEQVSPSQGTYESSLQTWINNFRNIALTEQASSSVRFYSTVSSVQGTCLGSQAYQGDRYIRMAQALGGTQADLCANPNISSALDTLFNNLSTQLSSIRLTLRQRFLVLSSEPNPATIRVTKYVGGNAAQAIEIPQDPINGWTYVGQTTQFLIDSPTPMNQATGYMIELHGTAKLVGNDSADVNFLPPGQNSAG